MRQIESLQDQMLGTMTFELGDGKWITVDQRDVREMGLATVLAAHGVNMPADRVPVFQRGQQIGTLPSVFDPMSIKPTSFLYDVRPNDFVRTQKGWDAAASLCPGDFECIPEFVEETAQ